MHSYANRQTDSRIGVRRCSTSPDIITGFEARRRLLSRYEYSRNERNDRERQENIRDYQRVRGTGRPKDPNRPRRPRCNPPLFDIPRPRRRAERTHQSRSAQRAEARDRHISESSESERRSSRGSSRNQNDETSDSVASHRDRERNETNSRKRSSGQDSVPQQQTASDAHESAPRKTLVARRSIKSDASDTSDTDHNEPSSSNKLKCAEISDSKGRDVFANSSPLIVTGSRVEPVTPEESVDNSSNDESSSDQKLSKKRGKKTKKERKKSKKSKKKVHKSHKVVKKEKKKSKKSKGEPSSSSAGHSSSSASNGETKVENGFSEGECQNVGSSQDMLQMRKKMAPMTKEQWEKQQSQVRREVSPTTGRVRLIKGTGEILEEIVSRDRHKAINRMATIGDGQAFQASLQKRMKKN